MIGYIVTAAGAASALAAIVVVVLRAGDRQIARDMKDAGPGVGRDPFAHHEVSSVSGQF